MLLYSGENGIKCEALWLIFEKRGKNWIFNLNLSPVAPTNIINDVRINSHECDDICKLGYITVDHVEELHVHNWAHVCFDDDDHTWSDVEARAVCLHEGFEDGTAVAFEEWDGNGWILTKFVCSTGKLN